MKYQVEFTDPKTGATSPIDTIDRGPGYTADEYIKECKENADSEYLEMIESGTVAVIAIN